MADAEKQNTKNASRPNSRHKTARNEDCYPATSWCAWHKVARNGTEWHGMARNGTEWHEMRTVTRSHLECVAQSGTKWHKVARLIAATRPHLEFIAQSVTTSEGKKPARMIW